MPPMAKWIIAAILLLPLAEIAAFILVAALVGLGTAFLLMLATTLAGFLVLRRAGRGGIARFRVTMADTDVAGIQANTSGFLTVLAGLLLFLPGFLTDLIGVALLIGTVTYAQFGGGQGRPVILIHGWPLSSRSWEAQIPALIADGRRVITYDRRGFGKSTQTWDGYDYDTFADDLDAVIDQCEAEGAAIVGFSMGGGEVARYLSRHGSSKVSGCWDSTKFTGSVSTRSACSQYLAGVDS